MSSNSAYNASNITTFKQKLTLNNKNYTKTDKIKCN